MSDCTQGKESNAVYGIIACLKTAMKDPKTAKNTLESDGIKNTLTMHLKTLQKSSYSKSFQNAVCTVAACLACFALIGLIPLVNNYYKRGNAFLFWDQGDKQQAEVAINFVKNITPSAI